MPLSFGRRDLTYFVTAVNSGTRLNHIHLHDHGQGEFERQVARMGTDKKPTTRLKQEREEQGLSQTRLAAWAEIHPSVLSRIEGRLMIPSEGHRLRIAKALRVSPEELFADYPSRIPLLEVAE